MARRYEIDACSGKLAPKILLFTIPMMLTNLLQLLYNAVDAMIVGQFVSDTALAAVGSTTQLINLIVNAFIGLSGGATIILAHSIGAGDYNKTHHIVHTAFTVSGIIGILLSVLGILVCKPLLLWTGTPENVIEQAMLYMRIYFLGMPGFMVYIFGSAIIRSFGDTRRPLIILTLSGLLHALLDLIMVVAFHMGIAGVALSTIISQYFSAVLIVLILLKSEGNSKAYLEELEIHGKTLLEMIKVGLPLSIQSTIAALSNVVVQSSINSLGSDVMAGNTAAANLDSFLYNAMGAFTTTTTIFIAQNYGAKNYKRIYTVMKWCLLYVFIIGAIFGPLIYLCGTPLLKMYCPDNMLAVQHGLVRLQYVCSVYVIYGIIDIVSGAIRGLGVSFPPTTISVTGNCVFRVIWMLTVFRHVHTLPSLYISSPVGWILTGVGMLCCFLYVRKKKLKPNELSTNHVTNNVL